MGGTAFRRVIAQLRSRISPSSHFIFSKETCVSLRLKVLLVLLIVCGAYTTLHYGVLRFIIAPSFLELERAEALRNLDRCIEAIHREEHALSATAHDWGAW